jgi:hypothetical protein
LNDKSYHAVSHASRIVPDFLCFSEGVEPSLKNVQPVECIQQAMIRSRVGLEKGVAYASTFQKDWAKAFDDCMKEPFLKDKVDHLKEKCTVDFGDNSHEQDG